METPTSSPVPENKDERVVDISPNVLPVNSLAELTNLSIPTENFAGGVSTIAKDTKSPNFTEGTTGWRLGSNGDSELNTPELNNPNIQYSFPTSEVITVTTPVAMTVGSDGNYCKSSALDCASFVGFLVKDSKPRGMSVLGNETYGAIDETGWTFTAQAGVDRCIFVFADCAIGTITVCEWVVGSTTYPGTTRDSVLNTTRAYLFSIPIGSSGESQDGLLKLWKSGGTSSGDSAIAITIGGVDQVNPSLTASSGTANNRALDQSPAYSINLLGHSASTTPTITDTRMTSYTIEDCRFGYAERGGTDSKTFTTSGTTDIRNIACDVNPSSYADAYLQCSGVVDGFTGLTPGATYYLSDTRGVISTTPGSTSVTIGKAISATQILIA